MGSLVSKVWDDYQTYREMCEVVNREPKAIRFEGSWYTEMRTMIEEAGVKSDTEWFEKMGDQKIYKHK
jgi:hypothetical protein